MTTQTAQPDRKSQDSSIEVTPIRDNPDGTVLTQVTFPRPHYPPPSNESPEPERH